MSVLMTASAIVSVELVRRDEVLWNVVGGFELVVSECVSISRYAIASNCVSVFLGEISV